MNTKKHFLLFVIFLLLNTRPIESYCPSYDLLKPCYCHSSPQKPKDCNQNGLHLSRECQSPIITCAGDQPINLNQIFSKVNQSIRDEKHRYFEWFYLSNTAIIALEANVFSGINFRNIYIRQCLNLKTINALAFSNSSKFVQNLWINATKLSDELNDKRNAFKAYNSLTQLKSLEIMDSQYTSIPFKAFNEYSSLKSISFHNYNERQFLEKINSNAFHRLTDLRKIDLRNNRISRINSFAFRFETKANHTIRIYLENNYLNSNSFKPNAFNGGNGRRVVLHLGAYNECNTQLKSLDKDVFESFLLDNRKNIIDLYNCPIVCDQRVLWINNGKNFISKRIRNLKCVPGIIGTKVNTKHNNKSIVATNVVFNQLSHKSKTYKTENKSKVYKTKRYKNKSKRKPIVNKTKKPKMTLKLRLGIE